MRMLSLCSLLLSTGCLLAAPAEPEAIPVPPRPEPALSLPASGDSGADPDRVTNLPHLFLEDAGHVLTAPARWEGTDWVKAGASTAAVIGSGLLLDRAVDRYMTRHANASWDRGAKAVQELGATPSVVIAVGTYVAGVAFKNPEVRATGIDTMVTMGIAQLLMTIPLKVVTGRSRPSTGQGTHDFHPLNGGESFPSGHTTQAFALASVIAEHSDRPWVSGVAYGLAGMVGLARVEQHQHFLSDVVAAGLIGTFVGKTVVRYNQSLRADPQGKVAWSFSPTFQPGGYGFSLAMTF